MYLRKKQTSQYAIDTMILQTVCRPPHYATFDDMRHMAGKVAVLRERTWELYSKQMTIEKSFATTGNTLTELKSKVNDCHNVSEILKRENSGIEREVCELRGGMRTLAQRADDLNKRLDELDQLMYRKSQNASQLRWYRENGRPYSIACK